MENQPTAEGSLQLKRSGSLRKVLPSKPSTSVNSRLSMSGRMMERPSSGSDKSTKLYLPFLLEYALMAEFIKFQENLIPGLYISPSDMDQLMWHGVLFVREGPYRGGVFRFQIRFSDTFPDANCPRVIFSLNVLHPAVSPETGDLNVAALFPKWRKGENHVWQVLQYVKDIFTEPNNCQVPLNQDLFHVLKMSNEDFQKEAEKCAKVSIIDATNASDCDINFIKFDQYNNINIQEEL